jgi:O-methyltransferase
MTQHEKELIDVKKSLSYKVGRAITYPARKIYDSLFGLSLKKEKDLEFMPITNTKETLTQNPLWEYFKTNEKHLIHKWIHYFDIYHNYFNRFRGKNCVVVEIGVFEGGSLEMWSNYFGDKAEIIGIDINQQCKAVETDKIKIFIGSQSDREFLREIKKNVPKIDILIDDGGHTMEQQIITFEELFDHISENGIYLCEDTHTSYWEEYGGGLKKEGLFIEFSKKLIDKLNAWHIRDNQLPADDFAKKTHSIHFFDSIVLIQKGNNETPRHQQKGFTIKELKNDNNIPIPTKVFLKFQILGINLHDNPQYKCLNEFRNGSDISRFILPVQKMIEGKIWLDAGETMVGLYRMNNVEYCIEEIIKNNIEGDFIETGVWRGGVCIFMRALLKEYEITDKKVWVADSFEGLPKPNEDEYPEDKGDKHHFFNELVVSLEQVKENFKKYGLLDEQAIFLKGWFKDTLPTAPIKKLSLLRLDGDMYESTMDALTNLYPKLQKGGFIIIDDWGAVPACKKAVLDFRATHNIDNEMVPIDWTGIYWKN